MNNNCKVCAKNNVGPEHFLSANHLKNIALQKYATNKSKLTSNRNGIQIDCSVRTTFQEIIDNAKAKVKVSAKPNENVIFKFSISNVGKKEEVKLESVQTLHTKYNFILDNGNLDGSNHYKLRPKIKIQEVTKVQFKSSNIGQYQTTILFNCRISSTNEQIPIVRDLMVFVEETKSEHEKGVSPYACKEVVAKMIYKGPGANYGQGAFLIPKNSKSIYLSDMKVDENADEQVKILANDIRKIFNVGITKENYEKFFHNLLWFEETVIRVNIKKYNMSGVKLQKYGLEYYGLFVPGLAEKRPSLMNGDILLVRPHNQSEFMFDAVIKEITDDVAVIGGMHKHFHAVYKPDGLFDVRFFTSRVPLERMHIAIHNIKGTGLEPRVFPKEQQKSKYKQPALNFFNPLIEDNPEQCVAVEHIVSGTSGTAPYLVHGPPGTGKTMTIVEAILQLVLKDPMNRIMVCTDSNMAADHVATMLIKYADLFHNHNFLLRASSMYRVWETLPECLEPYSNGTSRNTFEPVSLEEFMSYSIIITTLSHAAKFGKIVTTKRKKKPITHLFIDEAAQASEPAALIPISSLLANNGQLVLAGDPHQLGPVVISFKANKIGLGTSLMERLQGLPMYSHEQSNPNYVVMLRNNFRSDKEIIDIPDKLFYNGQLRALAKEDPLSTVDIFGEKSHSYATVFHGVLSKEQRVGKSPSYFNALECDVVRKYVVALVQKHKVAVEDIGIVTPYIRQVYAVKKMLRDEKKGYDKLEVGTVEAYQGKEKRVIIISTVRANCNLLDHDAKFQLGFLVDDKRFNVAITRAKAKVIIIGNPLCLEKDVKWRAYMQKCRDLGTYHGFDPEEDMRDENSNNLMPIIQSMLDKLTLLPNGEK